MKIKNILNYVKVYYYHFVSFFSFSFPLLQDTEIKTNNHSNLIFLGASKHNN